MEELLASQTQKLAVLHRGQEVEGEILSIADKEITLDLGAKSEGVLSKKDLPEAQLKNLKLGDKLKAYVYLQENEHGQVVLSSSPQSKSSTASFKGRRINWSRFTQARNQKSKLQGKVLEVNKGGLIVEVEGVRGFLPNSQVGFELMNKTSLLSHNKAGQGMENLINQDLTVIVIEVDAENNKLIFSQRGPISEAVKAKLDSFKKDQTAQGKIVAILPFGLVVDVMGTEGLVFISDVSWDRVEDLSKSFSVGQEVTVKVLGLDEELGRLNLSIKQLSEDPFAKLAEKYPRDEVVKGEVTGISEAGVTVKLAEAEGFLPAAKVSANSSYEVGKKVTFLVDGVDMHKRRINLAPFVTSTAGLIYK